MGVEHVAFHHPSRTWVDLGKGPWYELDIQQGFQENAERILAFQDSEEMAIYFTWVVGRFCGFARTGKWERGVSMTGPVEPGSVEILNDCGWDSDRYFNLCYGTDHDDLDHPGPDAYTKVGERYYPYEGYEAEVAEMVAPSSVDEFLKLVGWGTEESMKS